jgi:hypothetical protein
MRPLITAVCTIAAVVTPVAASAAPLDQFYERALMVAADQRCDLFRPAVALALSAAAAQARGAALRGGAADRDVMHVEALARTRAAAAGCASQDLLTAAGRVRNAFDGWTKLPRMSFPGERAAWIADRTGAHRVRWRLSQSARAEYGQARFGLAGRGDRAHLIAVGAFGDERPYAARLVFRDQARAPKPWLGAPNARPTPPRTASRVVLAEASSPAASLAPEAETAVAFRFPAREAALLSRLDPRERFTVEYVFAGPDGAERVRAARFEVGDFAAGRTFVAAGR